MLLWNHPYVAMNSFLQGMTAYNETRGPRTMIPLNTTIRALGSTAQKPRIHLLLTDWETGHLDLTPRSKRHLLKERTSDQEQTNPEENRTSAWNHDGGKALGRFGNQILGGHKLATYPANLTPSARLHVTIIDHRMNLHTPWFTNKQTLPHRLRILGNPCSKTIDLQIPTQLGQTCIEAILLALQIVGCQQEIIHKECEGIQVFTPNHNSKGGPRHPGSTWSEHTGLLHLHHHSTLADYMKRNGRVMMFLPKENNTITWGSACLAEDTEIRMPDGTFVTIQNSVGKEIWTDQQGTRKIRRIHKFDTLETDPPLYGIGGNWMTEFHFIWGRMDSKWQRALEFRGVNKVKRKTPKGPVFAVELDTDDYLTLRGGIKAATFGNCLIVEPRRQGYTQDFRFEIDQALRGRGLQKAYTIGWHHGGVGHRLDGSLILETGRIKSPQRTKRGQEDSNTTSIPHQSKQRAYRECGRCRKPDAKLKCACLATHYCGTQCQREDMTEHRQDCKHMTLEEINLIQSQLQQHKPTHGKFTIEVARLKLLSTGTHVKFADLLRFSGLGTNQKDLEHHYLQALQEVARLEKHISEEKTFPALYFTDGPGGCAPWPRQLIPGPTYISKSLGTVNKGPRSNPGAHQH